jgi:hypothetical protein
MFESAKGFKDLVSGTLSSALWDLAKRVFLLVFSGSFGVLISKIFVSLWVVLIPFKILLAIVLGSGGVLLSLFLSKRLSRFHPTFPRLDSDYNILEKEITYEYKDISRMIYRKAIRLKALKKAIDVYNDKYTWTGRGKVKISSTYKDQKDLEDEEKTAVPFFSATIEEPTEFLKLNLILPTELGIKKVTCEVSCGMGAKKPLSSVTKDIDGRGKVDWEIEKPKLLHHYEIRWVM